MTRNLFGGLAFVVTILFALSPAFADKPRYAVVDTQRIINESIIGQAARNTIEAQVKKEQAKLSVLKGDFEKQRSDLEKQGSILSESALAEKQEALNKKGLELQRQAQDVQEELARKNESEISKLVGQVGSVVKDIASDRGYTFVFERDKQSLVYAAEDIDITSEVIKILDEKKVAL